MRQTGKTYIIRHFGKPMYNTFIEINFELNLEEKKFFDEHRNPKEILEYLQLKYMDIHFDRNTLLFLDEIQACPSALTALKFMTESFPGDIIA